ncbi:hypothetical protein GL213_03500 [Halogeometricum borinquense]|uniref:Uncharacterized protein n=1 Tax=Halogeometricum borinquense (strain ATCC 700274 / DSM 11551 / JCM 10706 / KCTC 4070 / PR3) TaxID=469382 RepID=E4NN70_HALBP|nr:hypothetical protein [Halogeometricum borinquense]ADQ66300.1 hypothetical protein Hbor_07020 [Halogeometricum borinquense DSM 11551]ELY27711.1 hypothetical protein C499_09077 [Halogeometricum borinquense DSM 11551]QIQ75673.1 hypothetical protein GL213_03500 [Halogeometricum borinquense]
MQLGKQIQQSWGALFLFIYAAGFLYLSSFELSKPVHLFAAGVPSVFLVFLSVVFNDGLMEFFAGDVIEESFNRIDGRTGDDEFYWDADQDTQDRIDRMDGKAHRHLVTVLSGLLIGVSLPFAVNDLYGLTYAVFSLIGSLVVIYLFSYREYRNLRQVVKSSVKLYDITDED